ncbi:MAG: FAD-binding oxidoreductase [Jatrophihabitans sp.]
MNAAAAGADLTAAGACGAAGAGELAVRALRGRFAGELVLPTDARYQAVREIWNAAIDKQPAVIARCRQPSDVAAAIGVARELGLPISIRGGGHNIAGTALCEGGLCLDLRPMSAIAIDEAGRSATVELGLTWGQLDRATHPVGLATPGGIVSGTGVAGLALGGGFGWLSRSCGWTCDNMLAAQLITAEGEQLLASPAENPELFWALRGGGGNFGVVTSMTLRLHPARWVYAGYLIYRLADAAQLLAVCDEVMAEAADRACLVIGLGPPPASADLPEELRDQRVLRIALCHSGSAEDGERLAGQFRRRKQPAFEKLAVLAYPQLQSMLDAGGVGGLGHYAKSHFLTPLGEQAIATIVEQAALAPSPRSRVVLHTCGGWPSRPDAPDTAFGHRDAAYNLQIDSTWQLDADPAPHVAWARAFWNAMLEFTSGGVYVNFLGADADRADVERAYGQQRFRRLQQVKDQFDPTNVFSSNQNIVPSGAQPSAVASSQVRSES